MCENWLENFNTILANNRANAIDFFTSFLLKQIYGNNEIMD